LLSSLRARTQRLSRIVLMCPARARASCAFFFFHDPATTEIYTLSLHDALRSGRERGVPRRADAGRSAGLYARPAHHVPHAAGGGGKRRAGPGGIPRRCDAGTTAARRVSVDVAPAGARAEAPLAGRAPRDPDQLHPRLFHGPSAYEPRLLGVPPGDRPAVIRAASHGALRAQPVVRRLRAVHRP